ncbi:MAG: hypothetical protein KME17_26130 [Cyanosarcina radialis HA8281-LM2]|nr:hypothetical protein [Cyanosarcina radialis HA8281-LM2]
MLVDDRPVALEASPDRGRTICLEFLFFDAAKSVKIPFPEIAIALFQDLLVGCTRVIAVGRLLGVVRLASKPPSCDPNK